MRGRKGIHGDGGVGGAIKGQAPGVASSEVGLIGKDGTDAFCAKAAGEGGGEFDFQMDEEGAGGVEQQVAGFRSLDGSAAQGEDQRVTGSEARDSGVFDLAEGGSP